MSGTGALRWRARSDALFLQQLEELGRLGEPEEALRVAGRLDTGGVGINNYLGAPITIPFGGTKRSGVGRELGRSGMDQFANIKTYGIA